MDNSISKWTLLEAKLYCKNRGHKSGCCEGCRIADDNGYCSIQNAPEKWDIAEETDATDATDTNVGHKPEKPRLAEALGVDENAPIRVVGGGYDTVPFTIADVTVSDGRLMAGAVTYAIIHPESIIRAPRLTEAELAICKAAGAKWVSCNLYGVVRIINLWDGKPGHYDNNQSYEFVETKTAHKIASFYTGFDSVGEGDCICVEEAHNDD